MCCFVRRTAAVPGRIGHTAGRITVGGAGAFAGMRLARGLLFVVAPTDPLTFGAVALLLLGVAVAGALVPAAKAAGIQPVEALRAE